MALNQNQFAAEAKKVRSPKYDSVSDDHGELLNQSQKKKRKKRTKRIHFNALLSSNSNSSADQYDSEASMPIRTTQSNSSLSSPKNQWRTNKKGNNPLSIVTN